MVLKRIWRVIKAFCYFINIKKGLRRSRIIIVRKIRGIFIYAEKAYLNLDILAENQISQNL